MGNRTPLISNARVIAVDPAHRRLTVNLPSTQIITVRMAYAGPADGLRVNHKAMPGRGTEGIVVFPGGDNRNGFWLGSIYASAMDALTTDTDQFMEYDSHWSGHFRLLDQGGNLTESFADGSFQQVGAGTTVPDTFRHTVDSAQKRQTTQLSADQRVSNPPSPFNITLKHKSGTTLAVNPSGNVTVSGAAQATSTHIFNGTTTQIDSQGNLSINGAQGKTFTVTFNGATFQIDGQGNVSITTGGSDQISLTAGGNVLTIGATGVMASGPLAAGGNITAGAGGAGSVSLLTHRHGVGTPVAAGTIGPSPGT
jgi:hypothetical protein